MSNRRKPARREGWARPAGISSADLRDALRLAEKLGGTAIVVPGRDLPPPVQIPDTPVTFTVKDVIRLRDEFLQRCEPDDLVEHILLSHGSMTLPYHVLPNGRRGPRWTFQEWMDHLRLWLSTAELFFVTEEMTTLVRRAAAAEPPYEVVPDRVPAKVGFVVWADTLYQAESHPDNDLIGDEKCRAVAALWAEVDDTGDDPGMVTPGVMVVFLQDSNVLVSSRPRSYAVEERAQFRGIMGQLAYHEEYGLPYGVELWGSDFKKAPRKVRNGAVAGIMTTFIMMSQRVVHTTEHPLGRQQRRQYERAGVAPPSLRTVTLRRAEPKQVPVQVREPGQESSRRYTHRWWVAGENGDGYGYLRRTWYPSLNDHRLQYVWVDPYLKRAHATDDPILDSPKVNVLRR